MNLLVSMMALIWMVGCVWAADVNGSWEFFSAPMSVKPAVGNAGSPSEHEIVLPDVGCCGWWEGTFKLPRGGGVRFSGAVEIVGDDPLNDVMMYVTWYDPARGNRRGVSFLQRDFVRYSDRRLDGRRILRMFDDVFAVPGACDTVRVDLIAKWHRMRVVCRDVAVTGVAAPAARRVRCVVGNPHERHERDWSDPKAAVGRRLRQMEDCLTNIFAHVEHPDIILFSECFADTSSPFPRATAEPIPGGPSFMLAAKYAKSQKTNIAMSVHELDEKGGYYNTLFIVDRQGRLAGRIRKVHLTSGEYQKGMLPGDDFEVVELDVGRVGALTCWDNWFSESAKFVKRKGAELILFPLAGCARDHIDICFPARAIDTGVPFLVAIRQGHLPSGVIDRDGTWVAKTFEDCGFAVADIDLNERKRTFWLSVGPGMGDPYELYFDESRPEVYRRQQYGPRR